MVSGVVARIVQVLFAAAARNEVEVAAESRSIYRLARRALDGTIPRRTCSARHTRFYVLVLEPPARTIFAHASTQFGVLALVAHVARTLSLCARPSRWARNARVRTTVKSSRHARLCGPAHTVFATIGCRPSLCDGHGSRPTGSDRAWPGFCAVGLALVFLKPPAWTDCALHRGSVSRKLARTTRKAVNRSWIGCIRPA